MTAPLSAKDSFVALLEKHGGILWKVAASYTSNAADRNDLMQEIRLQLWKAFPRYSADRPFSTWMYRIALNVAISHLRHATRLSRQTVSLEELGSEMAADSSSPAQLDERLSMLQQVIAGLEPLHRALLLLYLDDHSYREIAAILGITETNVATKISRLKLTIRDNINKLTQAQPCLQPNSTT